MIEQFKSILPRDPLVDKHGTPVRVAISFDTICPSTAPSVLNDGKLCFPPPTSTISRTETTRFTFLCIADLLETSTYHSAESQMFSALKRFGPSASLPHHASNNFVAPIVI